MKSYGNRVAVIGAGPSGLAAARYLKSHGFDPVIYEQSARPGGQWNAGAEKSGVWPGMRANTSRVTTRFSDLDYPAETQTFPACDDVLAYLLRYAEAFGLAANMRLQTTVDTLARHAAGGWALHSRTQGQAARTEVYDRVVVATGRHVRPARPPFPGLDNFAGAAGVTHAFDYAGPEPYAGLSVVVAGCSVSALEIASELARAGADVTVTMRRQRYVLKALIGGVPVDNIALTRSDAWARETLPASAVAEALRRFIVETSGDPAEAGALAPAQCPFEAGIALSQDFLELVAAGQIATRPWMTNIAGRVVRFADGSEVAADAIVLGTGYELDLPFLDTRIRNVVGIGVSGGQLNLYHHTFHPDLQGLAFVGLFNQAGPYLPVVELQARWIAYAWAGLIPAPSAAAMRAALAAPRVSAESDVPAHLLALLFARHAGVEPDIAAWPGIARVLLFGPLSPVSFRLNGHDALAGAAWEVMIEAARLGAVTSPVLSDAERGKVEALAVAGRTDLLKLLSEPDDAKAASERRAA